MTALTAVKRKPGFFGKIAKHKLLFLMLLPALLYFSVVFRYGSMLGLLIAFQDYRPVTGRGVLRNDFHRGMGGIQTLFFFLHKPQRPSGFVKHSSHQSL